MAQKLKRMPRVSLDRYAVFIAENFPADRVPTLPIWVDAAWERGLPVSPAHVSAKPRTFAGPRGARIVVTEETPGSYGPAWLVMLLELISPKSGVLHDSTWDRIVARRGALHSAWMLGGYAMLLKVWRAPFHAVETKPNVYGRRAR